MANVNMLKLSDRGFPESLRHVNPEVKEIYWQGANPSDWISKPKVAVVGSRKFTSYGKHVTEDLVSKLARSGVVIISGLAIGIDTVVNRTAVEAGGTTAAVLPTSLEKIHPRSNLNLAEQILKNGGSLISEYSKDAPVHLSNFVLRNRIVSGLADVLLITEAREKGGTMHTARYALDQGKTVMAVPGNINSPYSAGCNQLIKTGAIAVTEAEDIFFALGIKPNARKKLLPKATNKTEESMLRLISEGTVDQEQLALDLGLTGQEIGSMLTSLELSGYIRPAGGGKWVLV